MFTLLCIRVNKCERGERLRFVANLLIKKGNLGKFLADMPAESFPFFGLLKASRKKIFLEQPAAVVVLEDVNFSITHKFTIAYYGQSEKCKYIVGSK